MATDPREAIASDETITMGAFLTVAELDGVAPSSDWHRWVERGGAPADERSPGSWVGGGWRNDLVTLRDVGFGRLVLTLEWATLEPRQGSHDGDAVEQFQELLDGAAELGFEVGACLVDGTLPGWFAVDEGGFRASGAAGLIWPRHVDWVGETFGDRVGLWVPIREPVHHAVRSDLLAMAPPGRADWDDLTKQLNGLLAAETQALDVLRGSSPVATHQTARLFLPRPTSSEVAALAGADGHAHQLDELHRSHLSGLSENAFDAVILQLRPAVAVDEAGSWAPSDLGFLTEGLSTALHDVADAVGDRSLQAAVDLSPVTEDGSAQADHLTTLWGEAEGLGVDTWWQTSPIDGWHWHQGKATPGVIDASGDARAVAEVFAR